MVSCKLDIDLCPCNTALNKPLSRDVRSEPCRDDMVNEVFAAQMALS